MNENMSIPYGDDKMKSCSISSNASSSSIVLVSKDMHHHKKKSLHSHEGDIYNAAIALLCLPISTRYDDVSIQDIQHSVITPQQSFDSSKVSWSSSSSNSTSFLTFHSQAKNQKIDSSMMDRTPTRRVLENSTSQNDDNAASLLNSSTFHGTVSLSMPEDEDNLSPLHCFIRKFGIEAFVVSNNDAQDKKFWNARNFKVKPGIVGMQCMHCKNKPLSERGPKSVHYPSSTKCIYYSMENWQRHHAMYCASMPKWILRELKILMSQSKTGAGGRRRYWADSAIALGMEDTPEGIIFVTTRRHPSPMECRLVEDSSKKNESNQDGENTSSNTRDFVECNKNDLLIGENERHEISEYLFLLLSQMEACSFSEEDRSGSRSKVKDIAVGYPGIQCKHCHGKSGVGRYFPISLETLTLANSDRNIHNHDRIECKM